MLSGLDTLCTRHIHWAQKCLEPFSSCVDFSLWMSDPSTCALVHTCVSAPGWRWDRGRPASVLKENILTCIHALHIFPEHLLNTTPTILNMCVRQTLIHAGVFPSQLVHNCTPTVSHRPAQVWQSQVEIKHYSVVCFDCVTTFKAMSAQKFC